MKAPSNHCKKYCLNLYLQFFHMQNSLIERITIDPEICHGKPTIRGLRYPVDSILEYLAAGDTIEDILTEFNDLEREDILACFAYASASMRFKDIQVPAA